MSFKKREALFILFFFTFGETPKHDTDATVDDTEIYTGQ